MNKDSRPQIYPLLDQNDAGNVTLSENPPIISAEQVNTAGNIPCGGKSTTFCLKVRNSY